MLAPTQASRPSRCGAGFVRRGGKKFRELLPVPWRPGEHAGNLAAPTARRHESVLGDAGRQLLQ
jgi:hypothetical protein